MSEYIIMLLMALPIVVANGIYLWSKPRLETMVNWLWANAVFCLLYAGLSHLSADNAVVFHQAFLVTAAVSALALLVTMLIWHRRCQQPDPDTGMVGVTLKDIFDLLPGNIYWKDAQGVCMGCNENLLKSFGRTRENYIGKTDFDLFDDEQAEGLRAVDYRVMTTGSAVIADEVADLWDGTPSEFLSHKVSLKNRQGEAVGILGVSLNITERQRDQRARWQLLENIINRMPGHVYWVDRDCTYLGCNLNQAQAAGLSSPADIAGKRNRDLPWNHNSPGLAEELDRANQQVMSTGKEVVFEEKATLLDGTEGLVLSTKTPLFNDDNRVTGMLGISIDITEQKRLENELRDALNQVEQAAKAKQEFIYNMRHDLRTPTSGLVGISTHMHDTAKDPDQRQSWGFIRQCSEELMRHIDEILDFTRLVDGKMPVVKKPLDCRHIAQSVVDMIMPKALDQNVPVYADIAEDVPYQVLGDPARLQRILLNLVGNAMKFTKEGRVDLFIRVGRMEERKVILVFTVKDTGIGIPQEAKESIFVDFKRLTPSYQGIYPGLGLGLRTVKQFMEDMGGEIQVESHESEGSTFSCIIPFEMPLLHENA